MPGKKGPNEDDKETTGTAATLPETPPKQSEGTRPPVNPGEFDDRKPAAKADHISDADTSQSTQGDPSKQRQVIAVSASKGPSAFFNLARKFLVTDEECDLSALEGAIISAVDAAHLLERSQLATIVRYVLVSFLSLDWLHSVLTLPGIRVQTSYVNVEPKRKRQDEPTSPNVSQFDTPPSSKSAVADGAGGKHRELRRARIVITVRRTESYKQWLQENPLQAIIVGDEGDHIEGIHDTS